MIVTSGQGLVRTVDERIGETLSRCLARRGMLYSECEAVDYLRMAPGTTQDMRGREGIEEVWLVLNGLGEFSYDKGTSSPIPVQKDDLILCPLGAKGRLRSRSAHSLELLLLAVLPASVANKLPVRKPVE